MPYLILIFTLISTLSWSMVTIDDSECPVEFEGKVVEVIEPISPIHTFSIQKVVFAPDLISKGNSQDRFLVDVLINGPIEIEKGSQYKVKLRNNKICFIEKI